MYPTQLDNFKIQQAELHRRAARQRLINSLPQSPSALDRITSRLGSILIVLGESLINRTQVAHR